MKVFYLPLNHGLAQEQYKMAPRPMQIHVLELRSKPENIEHCTAEGDKSDSPNTGQKHLGASNVKFENLIDVYQTKDGTNHPHILPARQGEKHRK